jgi:hypothetical protein
MRPSNAAATESVGGTIIPGLPFRGVDSWNLLQNQIAFVGVALSLLLVLVPPWDATAPNGMTGSIGHYLVVSSAPAEEYKYPSVDYARLFLEMLGIAATCAVGIFVTRTPEARYLTSR